MRHFILAMAFFCCCSTSMSAASHSSETEPTTTIIKLDQFSIQENLRIHELFKNDSKYIIVNSCEGLGIVVFDSKTNDAVSKEQASLDITTKLTQNGFTIAEVVEDLTKTGVMLECRAKKMQELDPEGVR